MELVDWLNVIFESEQGILALLYVIPITVGGVFLALAFSSISNIWLRTIAMAVVIAIQATGAVWVFLDSVRAFEFLVPFWLKYPYLNMTAILFFWIPVMAQIWYVTKRPSPRFWIAALIGCLAVVVGAMFYMFMYFASVVVQRILQVT